MSEKRYAIVVCLLVFLAMGFCGWYENYEPAPQADLERLVAAR